MLPLVFILPAFFQYEGVISTLPVTEALTFVLVVILITPLVRDFRKRSKATVLPEKALGGKMELEAERD